MAGYLQRFFDGHGAGLGGRALAAGAGGASEQSALPAHRPTSPLFTPDQQIAHHGFERGEKSENAASESTLWPQSLPATGEHGEHPSVASEASEVRVDDGMQSRDDAVPILARSPQLPQPTLDKPASLKPMRSVPVGVPTEPSPQEASPPPASTIDFKPSPMAEPRPRGLSDTFPEPLAMPREAPEPAQAARPNMDASAEFGTVTKVAPTSPDAVPTAAQLPRQPMALPNDTAPPSPSVMPLPAPDHASPTFAPARAQSPEPATARPLAVAPEPLAQPPPPEPDWKSIEARVDAMLDAKIERRSKPARKEQSLAPAAPDAQASSKAPPRPMTAAEASVIGKIGAAKRPTMIFGTRMR